MQVKAVLNGKDSFETSLVTYQGAYRLYLNAQMRQQAGVDVGDVVRINLEYAPEQRTPPMPEALEKALNKNKRAKEKWLKQPNSHRKEMLAYLNSLKTEKSIERNVSKVIQILLKRND